MNVWTPDTENNGTSDFFLVVGIFIKNNCKIVQQSYNE